MGKMPDEEIIPNMVSIFKKKKGVGTIRGAKTLQANNSDYPGNFYSRIMKKLPCKHPENNTAITESQHEYVNVALLMLY